MSSGGAVVIIIGGGQQQARLAADYGDATVVHVQTAREAIAFLRAASVDSALSRAWQAIKAAMARPRE